MNVVNMCCLTNKKPPGTEVPEGYGGIKYSVCQFEVKEEVTPLQFLIIALEALAGFDQLGLNPATLQDGLDFCPFGSRYSR